MTVVKMTDLIENTVLVSRGAASGVSDAIEHAFQNDPDTIEFDFSGIRVLAPSFIDQLFIVTERVRDSLGLSENATIVLRNCPPGMKDKLSAIGRAHDADVAPREDGTWMLSHFA
ncbi:MAG: STAS-like domain-containing protein [Chloroflexota bacterium]|nr:STAS-like domain-containing protein [Chloroflexota bacterium]